MMPGLTPVIGGRRLPSVSYQNRYVNAANQTVYTFTAADIGAEPVSGQQRITIVGVLSTGDLSSVTVGGLSATKLLGANPLEIWAVDTSSLSGTTANIVVTVSVAAFRCGVAVFAAYDLANPFTPFATIDTETYSTGTTFNQTIDVPAGGIVIACARATSETNRTFTFSGVAERYDVVVESTAVAMGGGDYVQTTPAFETLSISCVVSGATTAQTLVAVSLR